MMRTQTRSKRRGIIAALILLQLVVLGAIVFVIAGPTLGGPGAGLGWSWSFIGTPVSETMERKLPVADDRANVRVVNPVGKIDIRGSSDTSAVHIEAEKVVRGWSDASAKNALHDIGVDVREHDGDVHIEAEYPPGWFSFFGGVTRHAFVNLSITVPGQSDVEVEADMGEVMVTGVNGEVDIAANMGEVRLTDVSGDVNVEANMGEVTIRNMTGNLTGRSNMGSINVRGAMLTDRLDLSTNMGSIDFAGVPAQRSELSSNMGTVRIGIPADRAFDLDAETSLGSIYIALPFDGMMGQRLVHGTVGIGASEGTLNLNTDMGSIEIDEEEL